MDCTEEKRRGNLQRYKCKRGGGRGAKIHTLPCLEETAHSSRSTGLLSLVFFKIIFI
jgi:hypothetical protein